VVRRLWSVVCRPLRFELLCLWYFLSTQNPFCANIFAVTGTTILWSKQIAKHIAGSAGGKNQ